MKALGITPLNDDLDPLRLKPVSTRTRSLTLIFGANFESSVKKEEVWSLTTLFIISVCHDGTTRGQTYLQKLVSFLTIYTWLLFQLKKKQNVSFLTEINTLHFMSPSCRQPSTVPDLADSP